MAFLGELDLDRLIDELTALYLFGLFFLTDPEADPTELFFLFAGIDFALFELFELFFLLLTCVFFSSLIDLT
jgi:hypothetical protein